MIRPATLADTDGLRAAIIAAYAPFLAQGLDLPSMADTLADDITYHHVWVADDRGIILGGIVLHLIDGQAYLTNLAVHPNFGGKGLGRVLISTAETAARANGCMQMSLTTHKDMTTTRAFYAKLGWAMTGQDGDSVLMALPLY